MALTKLNARSLQVDEVGQLGGRRNLIINGDFKVNQRDNLPYTGASYCIDRWKNQSRSDGVLQTSRGQWADVGDDFFEYYMINNVTATPSDGSQVQINQFIENGGVIVNGRSFTISFYAKRASGSTTMTVVTEAQSGSNSSNGVSLTSDWQRFTITLNTVNETNFSTYAPLRLAFQYIGVGIVHVAGVQVEAGSVATPFEHRSYAEELALCHRYYVESNFVGTQPVDTNNTNRQLIPKPPQPMRSNPSISVFHPSSGTANQGLTFSSAQTANISYIGGFNASDNIQLGEGAYLQSDLSNRFTYFRFKMDAEI
jgi:hypothetical protein